MGASHLAAKLPGRNLSFALREAQVLMRSEGSWALSLIPGSWNIKCKGPEAAGGTAMLSAVGETGSTLILTVRFRGTHSIQAFPRLDRGLR